MPVRRGRRHPAPDDKPNSKHTGTQAAHPSSCAARPQLSYRHCRPPLAPDAAVRLRYPSPWHGYHPDTVYAHRFCCPTALRNASKNRPKQVSAAADTPASRPVRLAGNRNGTAPASRPPGHRYRQSQGCRLTKCIARNGRTQHAGRGASWKTRVSAAQRHMCAVGHKDRDLDQRITCQLALERPTAGDAAARGWSDNSAAAWAGPSHVRIDRCQAVQRTSPCRIENQPSSAAAQFSHAHEMRWRSRWSAIPVATNCWARAEFRIRSAHISPHQARS